MHTMCARNCKYVGGKVGEEKEGREEKEYGVRKEDDRVPIWL